MALVPVTRSDDGTMAVVEYRQGSASGPVVVVSTEISPANTAALTAATNSGKIDQNIQLHTNQLKAAWVARPNPGLAAAGQSAAPDTATLWRMLLLVLNLAQQAKADNATATAG